MGHKYGRRVTLRDSLIEEAKINFPEVKFIRKRDPKSFAVWFPRMDFKDGWEYDEFFDQFGHLKAKHSIRPYRGGILIEVTNYIGHIERRVNEPRLIRKNHVNSRS